MPSTTQLVIDFFVYYLFLEKLGSVFDYCWERFTSKQPQRSSKMMEETVRRYTEEGMKEVRANESITSVPGRAS